MKKRSIFTIAPIFFIILIIALACEMGENINEKQHEPNDSEEEATEITTYDSINGYIGENDVDFFEYDANRNYLDFTRLTVNNLETYNEIEARIFDEYMDEVEKLIGTQGENLNIKFANTGGKYFIKLKSYNDKEGEYTMSVSDLDANDDFEPDNTLSQGREIDYYPSNEMVGTILTDSDYKVIDYECFQVLVRAGERVDFDILPSSSQTTLHLVVYNANKEIIAEENPAQGESITSRYLYNQGSSDVIMFLKLDGSVPHNGGDYRISFSETTYTGKKKGAGIGEIE
jgi:hypothetical protein